MKQSLTLIWKFKPAEEVDEVMNVKYISSSSRNPPASGITRTVKPIASWQKEVLQETVQQPPL